MKREGAIRFLFVVAGLYDGLLGLAFLIAPGSLFEIAGVTPPNHFGYVRFPAALLVAFGILFFNVAYRPAENRNLIPYGILLKVSYCGVVLAYWIAQGLPWIWKPFAIADLAFLVLFLWAFSALRPRPA